MEQEIVGSAHWTNQVYEETFVEEHPSFLSFTASEGLVLYVEENLSGPLLDSHHDLPSELLYNATLGHEHSISDRMLFSTDMVSLLLRKDADVNWKSDFKDSTW